MMVPFALGWGMLHGVTSNSGILMNRRCNASQAIPHRRCRNPGTTDAEYRDSGLLV